MNIKTLEKELNRFTHAGKLNGTPEALLEVLAPRLPRFEQVAFYTPDIEETKRLYRALGCKDWADDTVTASGKVGDQRKAEASVCVAQLAFNYDLGIELELIKYVAGNNWHRLGGRVDDEGHCSFPFQSHMSYHVDNLIAEENKFERAGFKIVQRVRTLSHTNPFVIEHKRKYEYVIFDTRRALGFDLKLIKRIEGN